MSLFLPHWAKTYLFIFYLISCELLKLLRRNGERRLLRNLNTVQLQSVDIKLQSLWPNWCSAKEECNTSCCDVPCILFSTVSGHACHSPLQSGVGTVLWPYSVNFSLSVLKSLQRLEKKYIYRQQKLCTIITL